LLTRHPTCVCARARDATRHQVFDDFSHKMEAELGHKPTFLVQVCVECVCVCVLCHVTRDWCAARSGHMRSAWLAMSPRRI
jgi:hypothetical protein